MNEQTAEALAALTKRLEAVERQLAEQAAAKPARAKDWRRVIGNSADNEFTLAMQAEIDAAREADRLAAQQGRPE